MSIFKSTFKPFVVRQISARQNLLGQVDRPVAFSRYVSSKAPWVRMTSFVDYENSSDLAKKYILMGGALYNFNSETGKVSMRSGVGGRGASYGGDLGSTQYGIRPMPGITEVSSRSLGAYGSLTEATVKFYAWDVKQLEELSILFLRPGYKVLLEWGWSMYLDTSIRGESPKEKTNYKNLNTEYTNFSIQNTPFNTIDCFNDSITQDQIYDQLESLRHKYSGNYDGVLGSIRNFEYELMANGSYLCTTVLISIGDVIDTIRINDTIGSGVPSEENTQSESPEIKSQFELLFDGYCKLNRYNNRNLKKNSFFSYIDASIKPEYAPFIDTNIYTTKSLISAVENNTVAKQPVPVSDNAPLDERYNYFIQFAYFIHILNTFKNLFSSKEQTQIEIEIPCTPKKKDNISNGLCQASFNSVSINPNVVLIKNNKAILFKNNNGFSGFNPSVSNIEDPTSLSTFREFLHEDTNLGIIGNLYINIGKIISIYKEIVISGNGYAYSGVYLSKLLDEISFSLGSINDFDKFVSDNKICIIDKHYTEIPSDSNSESKFKLNILGNKSIVRSHKINSKIFPSQATMIAIAAQDRENVASIQTSTYSYLNGGLKDRLFNSTANQKDNLNLGEIEAKKEVFNRVLSLVQFVKDYVLTSRNLSVFNEGNLTSMNGYLNSLLVEVEGGTDYKAVVPISVEVTIDGLSGLTIGEIFTVDKNVLPKDYKQKSIGFIVTNITNKLSTTSWETSIASQVCILDQQEKQNRSKEKGRIILGDLEGEIERRLKENTVAMKIFNVLAAFTADYLAGGMTLDESGNIKRTLKTSYTRTALTEYPINTGGANLTVDEFFEYFSNLLKTYKKADPDQLFYLGFPIDLYSPNIKELLIKPPLAQTPEVPLLGLPAKRLLNTEPLATVGSATIEVETFNSIIRENIFYNLMPGEIKGAFDTEYYRVLDDFRKVIDTKAKQDIEENKLSVDDFGNIFKVPGSSSRGVRNVRDKIKFNIVSPADVDQVTGAVPSPIKLYAGYRIVSLISTSISDRGAVITTFELE